MFAWVAASPLGPIQVMFDKVGRVIGAVVVPEPSLSASTPLPASVSAISGLR
jgi:hypothetical protein